MKTAIVYDRVNKWGGAERVLLALNELFPRAPLYTALYHPKKAKWAEKFPEVIPSFLQNIPLIKDKHELVGTFMPLAFEQFNFDKYDLVISVTSEAAKGIITKPSTKHICYMLTPTRYLWSAYDDYFQNPTLKLASKPAIAYLKRWESVAAARPDVIVSISQEVQKRVKKYYQRDSEIIYPPVDVDKFRIQDSRFKIRRSKYCLVVNRMTTYKKLDIVIEAFNELGERLVVVGVGRRMRELKAKARKNIEFTGFVSDKRLIRLYQGAEALIFPQVEDFGIVAIEAQAAGTPVIAFDRGGAKETVIKGGTGVFFDKQTPGSLIKAVKKFNKTGFDKKEMAKNAQRFSKARFKKEFLDLVKTIS